MIFKGVDEQIIEFKIVNYEFPKEKPQILDWLLVSMKVKSKTGNWKSNNVSVAVSEIQELIDWFRNLTSIKKTKNDSYHFIEQNISFFYLGQAGEMKNIRIMFDMEAKPKIAEGKKEYFIDCEWTDTELKKLVNDLAKELKKYPDRIPPKQIDVLQQSRHEKFQY